MNAAGRSNSHAARALAAIFLAGSLVPAPAGETPSDPVGDSDAPPVYGRFEREVKNPKGYANPFQDVSLEAVFTSPSKRKVKFFGFYDGDGKGGQNGSIWKLRFMPDEPGPWSFEAAFSDGTAGAGGTFVCVAEGARPGPLRVDPANGRSWLFADGTRFFPRAYLAPELFIAADERHRRHWVDLFFGGKYRFNFCNANLLNYVAMGDVYNWQGTPYRAPDPAGEGRYVAMSGNGLFPFLLSLIHI